MPSVRDDDGVPAMGKERRESGNRDIHGALFSSATGIETFVDAQE